MHWTVGGNYRQGEGGECKSWLSGGKSGSWRVLLHDSSSQGYRKWTYALKFKSDKLSSVGQFGLRNTRNLSYCPIFGQIVMNMFRQCCIQHANGCQTMFCHTVQGASKVQSSPFQYITEIKREHLQRPE